MRLLKYLAMAALLILAGLIGYFVIQYFRE